MRTFLFVLTLLAVGLLQLPWMECCTNGETTLVSVLGTHTCPQTHDHPGQEEHAGRHHLHFLPGTSPTLHQYSLDVIPSAIEASSWTQPPTLARWTVPCQEADGYKLPTTGSTILLL